MKGAQIRKSFLDFFKSKGHQIVASSSVIPDNDPTLLFSNAGMNQFKDCFLGAEKRSYSRATTSQKCLRISGKHNDLENIGVTARHHTFFEMLGNFSFGDYFKAEAIAYAWELITKVYKIPESRLWITIFENDDEAGELWQKVAGVSKDRIIKLGEKDNFWAMGDTGPCGPCSEIHYYMGDDLNNQSEAGFKAEDGSYMEIWNLVFMQYDRAKDGTLVPLPKPAIDTGMGLERIATVIQGKHANYETDLFRDIISVAESLSGYKYDGSSYKERDLKTDLNYARDVAMRVIADHSRSIAFMLADGVSPGSDGRGYVLRRLIRRAVRHGRVLDFKQPFLAKTIAKVIELMREPYQELVERQDTIFKLVTAEEKKFQETIDAGLNVLQDQVKKLGSSTVFPGQTAFLLHDTYGFPLDLTQDALKPYKMTVDVEAFEQAMLKQKTRSRDDRKAQGITFIAQKQIDAPQTQFLGYEKLSAEAKLCQIISEEPKKVYTVASNLSLIFDATPFYAESGGQVGDSGIIELNGAKLKVHDTQKIKGTHFVHDCEIIAGELSQECIGKNAILHVDAQRRQQIRLNHSATHLVHAGLRQVLGEHVKQAGSRVDDQTSRFDYSHFEAVTAEQLAQIQLYVNEQIRNNYEVVTQVLPIEQARKTGAIALFGEKYGDNVRVIFIGPNSIEFCGGTHVTRAGDIGNLIIAGESGISAGVRRIESWSGAHATQVILDRFKQQQQIADLLKSENANLPEKIEQLLARIKNLEKELESSKSKLAGAASDELVKSAKLSSNGIKVITNKVDGADMDTLRSMVDALKKGLGSGVVALASNQDGQTIIVAGVTQDLVGKISAGNIIKEVAKVNGGKGGGRADFAQAGGGDPTKLAAVFERVYELV